MDQVPSPKNTNQGILSCWGRLKFKLPWTSRLRRYTTTRQRSIGNPGGGFRYDPLSYAQNFDDGWDETDEDSSKRGFSARYAAPSFKSSGDNEVKSISVGVTDECNVCGVELQDAFFSFTTKECLEVGTVGASSTVYVLTGVQQGWVTISAKMKLFHLLPAKQKLVSS